jgi:hypothetical protein
VAGLCDGAGDDDADQRWINAWLVPAIAFDRGGPQGGVRELGGAMLCPAGRHFKLAWDAKRY